MISFVSRLINRSACLHFFDYAQGQLGSGFAALNTRKPQKEIVLNNEKLNFPFR